MKIELIISLVSMVATVGSFYIALKAKSDVKKLEQKIIRIENNFANQIYRSSNNTNNTNYGTNSGVMSGNVTGGVSIGK
ncbi:hypothetical protein [Terrisporobacter hibernicus]|uniref:Uncharacterized protein n=1 Tax=Terrisporobacter hibernicus TaxID=2813371 RepID=A0AAX2ZK60_9FIRM|nr:hypothetical protein [Terrisporobacter hibernicus]UEL49195.1 hypothetical protein JW646_07045 [Terrisporobacter hibernicus]